jgi:acetyl esterase
MQILIYPVTDCDLERPGYVAPENQLLLTRQSMSWYWDQYLPDPRARTVATASPLRAVTLAGLPPTVVYLAEHDVLREEGAAYAERLRSAGVPVATHVVAGQMHGFYTMLNILPASRRVAEAIGRAVRSGDIREAEPVVQGGSIT